MKSMQQTVTHFSSELPQLKAPVASVSRLPLLVLIIPIGLFVAIFFDRTSTVTKLTVPLTTAGEPVVSKPFQLPSVNDRVSISTQFSVPVDTVIFLSTELIDDQGVVQLQYDKEGVSRLSNFGPEFPGTIDFALRLICQGICRHCPQSSPSLSLSIV